MTITNATNSVARNSGNAPFIVGNFSIDSLPNAAEYETAIAIVSNGDGGNIRTVYSDGIDWRFIYNNEVVSVNPSAPTENETYDLAVPASEDLLAGDLISLWVDDGILKARKADFTQGFDGQAQGFVKADVLMDETAYIYRKRKLIIPRTGLVLNADYYLADNGSVNSFPNDFVFPVGSIFQFIGRCLPDGLEFDPSRPILKQ